MNKRRRLREKMDALARLPLEQIAATVVRMEDQLAERDQKIEDLRAAVRTLAAKFN